MYVLRGLGAWHLRGSVTGFDGACKVAPHPLQPIPETPASFHRFPPHARSLGIHTLVSHAPVFLLSFLCSVRTVNKALSVLGARPGEGAEWDLGTCPDELWIRLIHIYLASPSGLLPLTLLRFALRSSQEHSTLGVARSKLARLVELHTNSQKESRYTQTHKHTHAHTQIPDKYTRYNTRHCCLHGTRLHLPPTAHSQQTITIIMSSSQSASSSYYYYTDRDVGYSNQSWQMPTIIEDVDITFDGKPLSALYEEDRRRLSAASSSSDEEEERGRQRVSPRKAACSLTRNQPASARAPFQLALSAPAAAGPLVGYACSGEDARTFLLAKDPRAR